MACACGGKSQAKFTVTTASGAKIKDLSEVSARVLVRRKGGTYQIQK